MMCAKEKKCLIFQEDLQNYKCFRKDKIQGSRISSLAQGIFHFLMQLAYEFDFKATVYKH